MLSVEMKKSTVFYISYDSWQIEDFVNVALLSFEINVVLKLITETEE